MSVSITGTSSNVQINNADLHVTNSSKKVIAPRAELSGISDIALTTSSNVGLVNTAPIHTLDVGSKFFVDETGATTVRVRGLLEADTINFGGSTADRVFVSDASGALSTDDGLQYNSSTNTLTLAGPLDANSTADIADTLTLSKASGTGLSVTADATVGGTLDVSGATTLTTISSNAITARGSLVVVNNDGTNNLIISAANGTSSVSGNFGVGGLATLNVGLKITSGDSLLKDLYANATTITDGVTVSSGTTAVQALTATTGGFTGAVGVDGDFDVNTDKFTVASATGNTVVAGDLDVRTDKLSVSATGVSTSGTLSVTGATTLNSGLTVTSGDSLLKDLYANATTITDGLTVSSGTTAVQALTATTLSTSGAATLASTSVTGNATVGGTLGVTGTSTLAGVSATTLSTSGAATLASAGVTGDATVGGTLGVTGTSTLAGVSATTLSTSGAATLASAGVTNNLTVGGTSTLAGALTLNASGNGLLVSNNALIQGGLQVNGNLTVDGELTVLTTNNLVVEDPIIELGNVHSQGLGVSYDVGMVFTQPSGSNVATFYDIDATKYRICKTTNSAHDTTISSQQAIDMEVTGNVTATDTITANSINLGGSNIRIEGNSIVFG